MASVKRVLDRQRDEEQRDQERWLTGIWAQNQVVFHSLRYGEELPMTKKEYEEQKDPKKAKEPTQAEWQQQEEARKNAEEQQKLTQYGLMGPQYTGAWLGITGIFGEPEESFEDFKQRVGKDSEPDYDSMQAQMEEGNRRMLEKLRRKQAEREHRREVST